MKSRFGGAQPCSNILSKQEEHHSELGTQAVSPVSALCQTSGSVQCLSSPLAWGLPGLGDGIHIALLLLMGECKVILRETGSVKDFIGSGLFLTGLHKCLL